MKKSKLKVLIAFFVTIAVLLTAFTVFGYHKDNKAEESLAERSAIPKAEIKTVSRMIKGLMPEQYIEPKITVLVCKSTEESRTYASKDIIYDKNIERQIALIALNPLENPICDNDVFNIKDVEVSWFMGQIKITLKGDSKGWNTISWVSENYSLESELPDHPVFFTAEQAENFKFKAKTTVIGEPLPYATI